MKALPKGVYDLLVTRSVELLLQELPLTLKAQVEELGAEDAVEYLARLASQQVRDRLNELLSEAGSDEKAAALLQGANALLTGLNADSLEKANLLTAISDTVAQHPPTPKVPLSYSALITNDQGLNYHSVLRSELETADRVDLICPFIGNQGLNLVLDCMQDLGSKLRVITTTYLGGTHVRALERIAKTGAQIKIVYERSNQKTALHAKAWIFHRETGFSTATIGSSNLSPRALVDGLEWNVRVGAKDAPQVLEELIVTFNRLWENAIYENFDHAQDIERVSAEIKAERAGDDTETRFFADLHPYPHQKEALEAMQYARLDGRHRNLIVAATGTGKTLLAAFDYERLISKLGGRPSLLFVAHRKEILEQSLGAFRAVLRDSSFGELHVGQNRSDGWQHVFASVQGLTAQDLSTFAPDRFDVIIVDEFHHAEAPTYKRLIEHFQPKELLGLTATPERADGKRGVIETLWPPTYELRLWHALERGLLCPFHYFGIDDGTDLSEIGWVNGRYEEAALNQMYVAEGEDRAALVVRELKEKCDLEGMRCVAFCASIDHAEYMAERFQEAGFSAVALHSGVDRAARNRLVQEFRKKSSSIQIVCTVDLFNEGVDIPEINVSLMLRPTESATIFIQQLGRGLRNARDKGALTVLDFVGQQNKKFRMDLRFRAMTGFSRSQLDQAIRDGFPSLPPGSGIRLDKLTSERVLRNIREAIPSDIRQLADEARRMAADGDIPTVGVFMAETGIEPTDLYRSNRSYSQVLNAAGLLEGELPDNHHRLRAIIHPDDKIRISRYLEVLQGGDCDERFERMLSYMLSEELYLDGLSETVRQEASDLLRYLAEGAMPLPLVRDDLPFALHAHYNRDEIVVPFRDNPKSMRQGTFLAERVDIDIHLLTLRKSERHFSPTTRYHDYFESPDLIHWESPSTTSQGSPTGLRYTSPENKQLIFVRENRERDRRPEPFTCLGFGVPIEFKSERPIQIRFKLEHEVPDHLYVRFASAAG